MSLLQNEEFLIWRLRTSYLNHNKDGIGERLINVDYMTLLADTNIRSAINNANLDTQLTHSPPIPVATAVASEYFTTPSRTATDDAERNYGDEEDNGIVTSRRSTETVGPRPQIKRRRHREQQEEDDSSDLSDESDEDQEINPRAVQQIRFAKMPLRNRAGSSPLRSIVRDTPAIDVSLTDRSKTTQQSNSRRGSLGAVEVVKQRARRDTTTSSDMSSENELDPSLFQRRPLKASTSNPGVAFMQDLDEEYEHADDNRPNDAKEGGGNLAGHGSEASSLSSEFAETVDSESLFDPDDHPSTSSPWGDLVPPSLNLNNSSSPKKPRNQFTSTLQALPPPRPISSIVPVSALGQAIRARQAKPSNPVEEFAKFSGKGALDPLNIKIYATASESPTRPFDVPIQKSLQDGESGAAVTVTVADVIGLCLWRYHEEGYKPSIPREKLDVNKWTLRIVDEGEVDYDFPPLNRSSNMTDFTSNNNRPARGRVRGKAFDEFGLVEATESQYAENKKQTPKYTRKFEEFGETQTDVSTIQSIARDTDSVLDGELHNTTAARQSPISNRKGSATSGQPSIPLTHSNPGMGPPKLLKIHLTSLEGQSLTTTIEVSTDGYIADVLDIACKRWRLDKTQHFLRLNGSNLVVPLDRQVEAIGARSDLDLVRRRFAHEGSVGHASSLSSSSPKTPLVFSDDVPTQKKKGVAAISSLHPLAQNMDISGLPINSKKWAVLRKQPMSFAPSHSRILLMDSDYLHICPGETGKALFDAANAKTSTVPFTHVVGSKTGRRHPHTIRVDVVRDRVKKRYDFEAQSIEEALEIVDTINEGRDRAVAKLNSSIS